ncbi:MAG: GAF domain-containing protein [Pseudomonadales bacterium]
MIDREWISGVVVAEQAEVIEEERVAALRALKVLDTESNPAIDAVVVAAAKLLDVPIALVSLVDKNRQWFKANYGLDGVSETGRSIAFCDHAIRDHGVFCVENAQIDPDFCDNPMVRGSPDVRFYAGAPLRLPSGHQVGTLCVIDQKPRRMDKGQINALARLGDVVVDLLVKERSNTTEISEDTSRRIEIVEQAIDTLVEFGVANFSVRKVALALDITPGHLQHYFKTRGDLYHAMLERVEVHFRQYYQQHIARISSPLDRLVLFTEYILSEERENKTLPLLREFWAISNKDGTIAETLEGYYKDIRLFAARAILEVNPELPRDQARLRASAGVAMLTGAFVYQKPWGTQSEVAGLKEYITQHIAGLPF